MYDYVNQTIKLKTFLLSKIIWKLFEFDIVWLCSMLNDHFTLTMVSIEFIFSDFPRIHLKYIWKKTKCLTVLSIDYRLFIYLSNFQIIRMNESMNGFAFFVPLGRFSFALQIKLIQIDSHWIRCKVQYPNRANEICHD